MLKPPVTKASGPSLEPTICNRMLTTPVATTPATNGTGFALKSSRPSTTGPVGVIAVAMGLVGAFFSFWLVLLFGFGAASPIVLVSWLQPGSVADIGDRGIRP